MHFFYTETGEIWFKTALSEEKPAVVAIQAEHLSETEANLISLLLQNVAEPVLSLPGTQTIGKGEGERRAKRLGAWLNERFHEEEYGSPLPEEFKTKLAVTEEMVPFLLVNESHHEADISYKALQRLLRSYFDGEIVLILLEDSEWLFLADPRLLDGLSDEKEDHEEENGQDLLSLFCMGLYELVSSEWVGDFHVAAIPQVKVMDQLVEGLRLLRETLLIGRTFNVKEHIHLSDGLHLERLLYSIPDEQRTRFLEEYASHHMNVFEDEETVSTLESFFELDCNVSETAKRLYIHRNTLLYRLDKIKQETGLDVRSFGDAVLVKLTLLLYKLTKRK
ncbi:PucR family transcriptional regulator [Paenibacillus sp. DMB20]|uniref:PucR family transcriptional regulator n=1 Tax=Paenibacillus sp. DMB20 TaxID=1642570 RepID=UPI00069C90BA|nr:helix-turn-helix domain-containing protein [Paenibacillus sp. DMB20]